MSDFGRLPDGRVVHALHLGEPSGLRATIMTYGGNINTLTVPIRDKEVEVILGHPTLEQYLMRGSCRSAIIGRYANRIAGGHFNLDGRAVHLNINDPPNSIHGGRHGFDRAVWEAETEGDALVLHHLSPDGDQGFPGALEAEVRYTLTADALIIAYSARADAPTVVNLTNHAYFNLTGDEQILDHVLNIDAERFVVVDQHAIPTGELRLVAETPLDFRNPRRIGERIGEDYQQLKTVGGYDHTFVLSGEPAIRPVQAARLEGGEIVMNVLTTEPGVQFYSGNSLGKTFFKRHSALCLETQHFPDSPNRPEFPSTLLRPGETFQSTTVYRFSSRF